VPADLAENRVHMDTSSTRQSKHQLPALPYGYAALEPHVDARTMQLHHDEHHASYVEKLNTALAEFPELQARDASWLLLNLDAVPRRIRTVVRNNAGGHLNHSMFWRGMAPGSTGLTAGPLATAIDRDFGSLERFKARFEQAGSAVFGSGWVWLARVNLDGGKLQIYTTPGHGNPLTQGRFPILVNDVWEHAYYLKHENRRDAYLHGWWRVVDWQEAARRFEQSDHSAEREWEDEGGRVLEKKAPAS
jgi:superoxide dismutase, Fe-Mn family